MVAKLIKIGNSNGFIIPKSMLKIAGIDTNAEMSITKKGIVIAPFKRKLRDIWAEQLSTLPSEVFELDEEEKEWLGVKNKFDEEEWK